ncbi:hypothetical protein DFH07DRAFT_482628 [Mycena maculata]|uniref:Uncharacterized protein n=1 Tax=Mycena maculata TaxID=230809 RepID=A0AAD7J3N2_9AGAR|nr:hypothetical protein DFH07DRAFT_482628 [Mycena maculata]
MTRSASPTGVVEFSYDFPVASMSALPSSRTSRTRPSSPRRPSPVRPHWEYVDEDRDEEEDEEYASYGYPSRRRGITVPIPAIPSLYPYAAPQYPAYPYAAPAYATPSSYESESSCSSVSHHKKIKKTRPASIQSIDSSSPYSSPSSAPYELEDDFEPSFDEEEEERGRQQDVKECKPHLDLRRQWAALSLRVQFGVFRAKKRLRSRVMSV